MHVSYLTLRGTAHLFDPWTAVRHSPDDQGGMASGDAGGDPGGADAGGDPGNQGGDDQGGDPAHAGQPGTDDDEPMDRLLVDDDEDEDPTKPPRTEAERLKALEKRNRKLKRRLARTLPLAERLKGVQNIDEELHAARSYRELLTAVKSNPRLALQMLGVDEDGQLPTGDHAPGKGRSSRTAPEVTLDDVEFDDSVEALGFDPNANAANKSIAAFMRRSAQMEATVKRLLGERQLTERQSAQDKLRTTYGMWNTAAKDALGKVPKHLHGIFIDHVKRTFIQEGVRGRATPQQVINSWLKSLQSDPSGRMKNADTQRRAEAAARTPQTQRLAGQGAANTPNGKKTLASVRKNLQAMPG